MSEQEKFYRALNEGRVRIETDGYVQQSESRNGPHTGKLHEHRKFKIIVEDDNDWKPQAELTEDHLLREGLVFFGEQDFKNIFGMNKQETPWYDIQLHSDGWADYYERRMDERQRYEYFMTQLETWRRQHGG